MQKEHTENDNGVTGFQLSTRIEDVVIRLEGVMAGATLGGCACESDATPDSYIMRRYFFLLEEELSHLIELLGGCMADAMKIDGKGRGVNEGKRQ